MIKYIWSNIMLMIFTLLPFQYDSATENPVFDVSFGLSSHFSLFWCLVIQITKLSSTAARSPC